MEIVLPQIAAIGIFNSSLIMSDNTVSKPRKTAMFEIEIPIQDGGISFVGEQSMPIKKNMIICIKPGQKRHTKTPFKCYYIHMMLNKGALYEKLMELPDFILTEKREKYIEIFKSLCEHYDSSLDNDVILLQSLVLKLSYFLIGEAQKNKHYQNGKNAHQETIEKVIKYINNNLTEDLSLNAVAEYAGFSTIHFHNCFKSGVGKTLRDYVEEQRIKKAVNILISTDRTLTDVAYECGFSSQSYFSLAFKRRMKMTPREYVKEVIKRYEAE